MLKITSGNWLRDCILKFYFPWRNQSTHWSSKHLCGIYIWPGTTPALKGNNGYSSEPQGAHGEVKKKSVPAWSITLMFMIPVACEECWPHREAVRRSSDELMYVNVKSKAWMVWVLLSSHLGIVGIRLPCANTSSAKKSNFFWITSRNVTMVGDWECNRVWRGEALGVSVVHVETLGSQNKSQDSFLSLEPGSWWISALSINSSSTYALFHFLSTCLPF